MPRKNVLTRYQTLTNADASISQISAVTNIQFLDNVGIQANFTGTPVGTLNVQISADYQQDAEGNVTNTGNWINLGAPYAAAISGPGSVYFDLNQLSAPYVRLNYTAASGSGTLNSFITSKEI